MKNAILARLYRYCHKYYPLDLLNLSQYRNNTFHLDQKFIDISFSLFDERRCSTSIREMYNIYSAIRQIEKVQGDMAEVGVYRGGSAKLICELKGTRQLHLFDTFKGIPESDERHDVHKVGDLSDTSLAEVQNYLSRYQGVSYYQGIFPDTAAQLNKDARLSFVNLDADQYRVTLESLAFFYPKLNRGGVLISHDYRSLNAPGVKEAFDEFFRDKPEPIIELWESQCMITKF